MFPSEDSATSQYHAVARVFSCADTKLLFRWRLLNMTARLPRYLAQSLTACARHSSEDT